VKISRFEAGSGLGLGFGAFLTSFLPLSLFPMCESMTQTGRGGKAQKCARQPKRLLPGFVPWRFSERPSVKRKHCCGDNVDMEFKRSSGVLLHISSLASRGVIGDLGPAAHAFVEFLSRARQHVWQILPLSPTGYGNSPYAAMSAFAGNPSLISLELLCEWGWIGRERIDELDAPGPAVDFGTVEQRKLPLLLEACGNFLDHGPVNRTLANQWDTFAEFCRSQADWLEDYALFAVLSRELSTAAWAEWPELLRRRSPDALAAVRLKYSRAIALERALQFAFSEQWRALREAAARHRIRILGDVAIFVNFDSADVWAQPEIFELDAESRPTRVAGVPPDYFSETGQRWGNPLYRWDVVEGGGYRWWIERIRRAMQLYDIVRLDHFRGFEAYWAIPAAEGTAVRGEWVKGPGLRLFLALEEALGPLALVAEDLGMITAEVDELRNALGLPGMKVLQFGFGDGGAHIHLPHRHTAGTVAYTGTHDNDTTQGWWHAAQEKERRAAEALLGPVQGRPAWPMIRAAAAGVAQMAIVPAQDLLELGSEARMNTPAVADGNWSWRAPEGCWTEALAENLAALTEVTDRDNDPLGELV
jgi:4-alpha-glucanotransferase